MSERLRKSGSAAGVPGGPSAGHMGPGGPGGQRPEAYPAVGGGSWDPNGVQLQGLARPPGIGEESLPATGCGEASRLMGDGSLGIGESSRRIGESSRRSGVPSRRIGEVSRTPIMPEAGACKDWPMGLETLATALWAVWPKPSTGAEAVGRREGPSPGVAT